MSKKSTHLSKNIGIIQYFVSVLNSFHHQKLIMLLRVDIKRSDVFYTTGHFLHAEHEHKIDCSL